MHYLNLRPRVMDPRRKDDITDALLACVGRQGDMFTGYVSNWYPEGLRERTLGLHARGLVGVTRFYPTFDPKVVVDFEPAPPDKWWHDEKVRFFHERGILYFPISLTDKLTEAQFIERYRDLKIRLERAGSEQLEDKALAVKIEEALQLPLLVAAIDALAVARADAMRDPKQHPYVGAIRLRHIRRHKEELLQECRKKMFHGMDPDQCCRELADETQRWSHGQVPAAVAG